MRNYALAVLLMFSAALLRGASNETPGAISIYTQFEDSAASASLAYMRQELGTVMSPFHLHVEWRSLAEADGKESFPAVMVVHFHGRCRADAPSSRAQRRLGMTHISEGEIIPFAAVDCDSIRELISAPMAMALPEERDRLLGKAMARVLAHELYHYLARTTQHASRGIAKARYTRSDLAAACFRFDEDELQDALRRLRQGNRPSPPLSAGE